MILKDGYILRFHKTLDDDGVQDLLERTRKRCIKTTQNGVETEVFNDHNHNKPRRHGMQIQLFSDRILHSCISHDATFSRNIWSDFTTTTVRTTNGCESCHLRFKPTLLQTSIKYF